MAEYDISIEALSDEVIAAYAEAELLRAGSDSAAIEWTFANNTKPFAVAREDGKIVGLSSYIHSQMKFGQGVGNSLQAVDSFVMPQARRKGLFTKLARAYRDHAEQSGCDLVWGFPNENAAPAWFNRLGWTSFGQAPFLVKPLRAGYFLRKFGVDRDFKLSHEQNANAVPVTSLDDWVDPLWEKYSKDIYVSRQRDVNYLSHRLFKSPEANSYRVVTSPDASNGALVITREAQKHGGKIAYLMEAFGEKDLRSLISSELGYLSDRGTELVLAWSYPWSPNYATLRKCGFLPLPERLRPIKIYVGASPISDKGAPALSKSNWYLSYLDSDTI